MAGPQGWTKPKPSLQMAGGSEWLWILGEKKVRLITLGSQKLPTKKLHQRMPTCAPISTKMAASSSRLGIVCNALSAHRLLCIERAAICGHLLPSSLLALQKLDEVGVAHRQRLSRASSACRIAFGLSPGLSKAVQLSAYGLSRPWGPTVA